MSRQGCKYFQERNQTHYETLLDYSANWGNVEDPDTWIKNSELCGDGRYIFRDHPSLFFAKYYWKYFPNMKVIHLTVKKEFDYFARLTFKKLAHKIQSSSVDYEFIMTKVNNKCSKTNADILINWAHQYEWVWLHELLTANTFLSENGNINNYEHCDDIKTYEIIQAESISYQSNVLPTYLSQIFDDYITVNIDSLIDRAENFCNNIILIIIMHIWIYRYAKYFIRKHIRVWKRPIIIIIFFGIMIIHMLQFIEAVGVNYKVVYSHIRALAPNIAASDSFK